MKGIKRRKRKKKDEGQLWLTYRGFGWNDCLVIQNDGGGMSFGWNGMFELLWKVK